MFPDLNFSQIQIRLNTSMTPTANPTPEDVETNEELVVTNGPSVVANDPMNPLVQSHDPPPTCP